MAQPTISPWMSTPVPQHDRLEHDQTVHTCIVGAGIAGLSIAYRLAREGRTVVVLDDGPIGGGESSKTTAHLTAAFDDRYHVMSRLHGLQGARVIAESHSTAIDEVERIVRREEIDCSFQRLDGYLFVPPKESTDVLETELAACHAAGLTDVEWADHAPLGTFDTRRCLRFPQQAQFHPVRYLDAIAREVVRLGGRIFTHTHASTIEGGKNGAHGRVVAAVDGPVIHAANIVVATNTPVNDWLTLHTKQYPYRTYVIAAPVPRGSMTRALFWDTPTPYHYLRLHDDDGVELLIVGGEDHKTGQEDDAIDPYGELERWTRERVPDLGPVEYRWSGQVMEPMDGVAFIGRNPGEDNVWIVTGDSGNGMTHGVIAGMLIGDQILGRNNPWEQLYDPSRKTLRAAGEFARENMNMAAQYADWITPGDVYDERDIPVGCGAILREGLKKYAVYRDERGRVHRFSAVCPHLGAILRWNPQEQTWDCPAHGSRFEARGGVLNGPANNSLTEVGENAHAVQHRSKP